MVPVARKGARRKCRGAGVIKRGAICRDDVTRRIGREIEAETEAPEVGCLRACGKTQRPRVKKNRATLIRIYSGVPRSPGGSEPNIFRGPSSREEIIHSRGSYRVKMMYRECCRCRRCCHCLCSTALPHLRREIVRISRFASVTIVRDLRISAIHRSIENLFD